MNKPVAQTPKAPARSAWFNELVGTVRSAEAHSIMLHTGVADYERIGESVSAYLGRMLSVAYPVVAMYSVSKGIHFPVLTDKSGAVIPQNAMRAAFVKTTGIEDPDPTMPLNFAPEPAVAALLEFLRKSPQESAAVILDRVDNIVGELVPVDANVISTMEMLHNAGTDPTLEAAGNPLIMLTPNLEDVRPQVRRASAGIKYIEVPLPSYDDRLAFARLRLAQTDMATISFEGITVEQLASLTAGLMRRHLENILLRAKADGGKLTRALAMQAQRELMDVEYAGIVKRIDKPFRLEHVGGHVEAKQYVTKRLLHIEHAPSAILWVGPPGTGKTMIANAIANESGLNCLEVDLAQLMGGIVGETERNVARFRQAVKANAPCHVIMDEIDQKIRRGEGGPDSGGGGSVENRLFSAILEITGDTTLKGEVVWHFMSNRPDLLDSAFLSRMGAVIPLLPAESDEARADVMWRIIDRLSTAKHVLTREMLIPLAHRVEKWSGRDLEQVAIEAIATAQIDGVALLDALDETITYRRADTSSVAKQVKSALAACKDLRLVPEQYRSELQAQPASDWKPSASGDGGTLRTTRKITNWDNAD